VSDLTKLHHAGQDISIQDWVELWCQGADGKETAPPLPPFPEPETQRTTNNVAGRHTMEAAGEFYRLLTEEIPADRDDLTILDYGAGWGRITRLLLRSFKAENITAVDVDKRLVKAGGDAMPAMRWQQIDPTGDLPLPPADYDVIIANSVFSHLSESLHMHTLERLRRHVKPGGRLIATTLSVRHLNGWVANPATREWITGVVGEPDEARATLAVGQMVFGHTHRWHDYGIAILPDGWTTQRWPSVGFEVEKVRSDYSQLVNVARPV